MIANTKYISEWKSKRLSDETIKPSTSDISLSPVIDYLGNVSGIHFSYNKKLETEENFIRYVWKIEKVLKLWKSDSGRKNYYLKNFSNI